MFLPLKFVNLCLEFMSKGVLNILIKFLNMQVLYNFVPAFRSIYMSFLNLILGHVIESNFLGS